MPTDTPGAPTATLTPSLALSPTATATATITATATATASIYDPPTVIPTVTSGEGAQIFIMTVIMIAVVLMLAIQIADRNK